MRELLQHYIDGKWVDSEGGQRREVINPATEEPCAVISVGTKADVDKAVAAAKRAFKTWSQTTREERLAVLNRIVEEYKKRGADLAVAMAEEMGAPVSFAGTAQVGAGIGGFLGTIAALQDFNFLEDGPGYKVAYEPIGVVGMITPWNWPLNQIALKVAPALAGGNTMVLKPSEECPTNAKIFAEILDAAGVPPGVFNLVQGDGPTTGNAISSHPDVDMVSFTGSTRAGIAVAIAAAPTVKRVHQELGGKSPNVVLPDADFAKHLPPTLSGPLVNTGQSCISPTKVLVPRERMGEAAEFAKAMYSATPVGDPMAEGNHLGPVVNKAQFEKVRGLIQSAIDEGAKLVTGGPDLPANVNRGYYIQPTVFVNVKPTARIMLEEIFGPVLAVCKSKDFDHALQIANNTVYGLTGAVYTRNEKKLARAHDEFHCGNLYLNRKCTGALVGGHPFGGFNMSGTDSKAGGRDYLLLFMQAKMVTRKVK